MVGYLQLHILAVILQKSPALCQRHIFNAHIVALTIFQSIFQIILRHLFKLSLTVSAKCAVDRQQMILLKQLLVVRRLHITGCALGRHCGLGTAHSYPRHLKHGEPQKQHGDQDYTQKNRYMSLISHTAPP